VRHCGGDRAGFQAHRVNRMRGGPGEVVSALEWAEIRALGQDGVSKREIARRLGINRRTVTSALAVDTPTRYVRAPAGSQLDPLMPVIRQVLEQ
jgi:transposase